ncbi:MAG: hypothetical protein B6I26_05040 [Desulfobacteraceae bacterium 4572_130]|nr:MAG: hypothetical protein B6I26_05040 [Desulfobacteraceae bacterium 4572_130]
MIKKEVIMPSQVKEKLRKSVEKMGGCLEEIERKAENFIKKYKGCLDSSDFCEIKTKENIRKIIDEMNREENYIIILRSASNKEFKKYNKSVDSFIYSYGQNNKKILIVYNENLDDNEEIDSLLFRILHEIAHLYLNHTFDKGNQEIDEYISEKKEYEANYFASALLLNKKKFKKALKDNRYNLEMISRIYKEMSYEILAHRCASLSEGEIHLLKTNLGANQKKGSISKRFMLPIPEDRTINTEINICNKWCAVKAFKEQECKQISTFKNLKDGKDVVYYCYSKLIKKYNKEYTITIGCTEDFKKNMSQFDDDKNIKTEIFYCFAKEKKCNEECIN